MGSADSVSMVTQRHDVQYAVTPGMTFCFARLAKEHHTEARSVVPSTRVAAVVARGPGLSTKKHMAHVVCILCGGRESQRNLNIRSRC